MVLLEFNLAQNIGFPMAELLNLSGNHEEKEEIEEEKEEEEDEYDKESVSAWLGCDMVKKSASA
jgi:hypothetical protein